MNKIALVPHIVDKELDVAVFIDDLPFDLKGKLGIVPDIYYIKESLKIRKAEYCPVFTCTCGDAGCAGIKMEALSDTQSVSWIMTHPGKFYYSFSREDYVRSIEDFQIGLNYLLKVKKVENELTQKFKAMIFKKVS